MGRAKQTVERRQLGLALKRFREQAGLSQLDAARIISRTHPIVSRAEEGIGTLDADVLELLLDAYRVPDGERETMRTLGALARKRQPRGSAAPYTDTLPGAFQRITDMENDASAIHQYQRSVIPGHLQTPRYMRAVMRACDGIWWQEFGPEAEDRVEFRLARQAKVLDATTSKSLRFVLTEDALIDDGLHSDVMREQLDHLLALVKKHPDMEFRVLRAGALDNPAPNGGLTVLDFAGSAPRVGFAHVVYGPSSYFSDGRDTAALMRAFLRVQGLALSPQRSLKLIRDKIKES
jgi:transcriptional regulator with XRE-family HTH domain